MNFNSLIFRLLITVNGLLILTIAPALSDNQQQVKTRPIRVTTGIGAVQGWEQGLVEKNPNLGRWHWDPIYYYKQGSIPVTSRPLRGEGNPTGKQASPANPINRSSSLSYQTPRWHDVKPIHIPYSPQAMEELRGRLFLPENHPENTGEHNEILSGKLIHPSTIATYKSILPERNDSLNTALKYNSQSTAVYGQLLNAGSTNKSKNKKIITRHRVRSATNKGSQGTNDAQKNK